MEVDEDRQNQKEGNYDLSEILPDRFDQAKRPVKINALNQNDYRVVLAKRQFVFARSCTDLTPFRLDFANY